MDRPQELAFRLDDVASLFSRKFEEKVRTPPLQLALCKALVVLAENQGVSQKRLAEISEIDPARLVRIVDRMEANGWAERRPLPGDRRVWTLALTENAKPVLRLIWSVISEIYVEALRGLSADEIRTMVKVLESVHSNLSAYKPIDSGAVDSAGNEVTAGRRLRFVRQMRGGA
jgi:MarR family transcriptional regulator, transcriptional regulator for hemolysin